MERAWSQHFGDCQFASSSVSHNETSLLAIGGKVPLTEIGKVKSILGKAMGRQSWPRHWIPVAFMRWTGGHGFVAPSDRTFIALGRLANDGAPPSVTLAHEFGHILNLPDNNSSFNLMGGAVCSDSSQHLFETRIANEHWLRPAYLLADSHVSARLQQCVSDGVRAKEGMAIVIRTFAAISTSYLVFGALAQALFSQLPECPSGSTISTI